MEWLIEVAQTLLLTGLAIWVLVLRRELKTLYREQQMAARAIKKSESLSAEELRALQESLAALVQEVESFVEEHREEMGEGLEQVRGAIQKIETVRESAPPKAVPTAASSPRRTVDGRVLRIAPSSHAIQHPQAKNICRLHAEGHGIDTIARKLRIGKGEVELILNLS